MKRGFLIIFSLLTISCSSIKRVNIEPSELFNRLEREYLVLIYLDGCVACRNIKLIINALEFENIYFLDFTKLDNQSDENNNIGKTDYSLIYIKYVPTLFVINNKTIEKEYIGFEDVRNFLYSYK